MKSLFNARLGYALLLAIAVAAPFFEYPVLLMELLCFALFACAFNLLIGYTGLLSFGHAAFLGGAGYITGYSVQTLGFTPELGLLAGTGFAALLGLLVGALAIRRQGIYFSMITLALAQMMYFIWLRVPFTGGEDGMQGVARGRLFGVIDLTNDRVMYFVVLAIFIASFWLIHRTIHSPFGQVLKAIKENEPRAISLGYDVDRFKLLAFVLSAALAGLAGSTKVLVMHLETLTDVHWSMSGLVVLMTLVGGLGTVLGPIAGALIVVLLEHQLGEVGNFLADVTHVNWFRALGENVGIATGLIFIVCVLLLRKGLVGEIAAAWERSRGKH